ncbi:hypothetical protein ACFPN1_15995 [Lysobacter yangpyeongensis]|uniref:Uncharacterized protein n=1 Tax=Lysobacter yangpyeongensis TaxID=346182 RepID=A0ABW0SR12_9GAMM
MKLSSLANLISGALSAADYSAEIAAELAEHTRHLGGGGSAPVAVSEDVDLVLDRAGLGVLCRLFASGQLTAGELAYTADALQMAERVEFSSPEVADDLDACTDPEINGPLSAEKALAIAGRGAAA